MRLGRKFNIKPKRPMEGNSSNPMKQKIKSLLIAAALGLWANAAMAHHILGRVACTDTSPALPQGGVTVTIQAATGGTYTTTTAGDGLFVQFLPAVTDTYTVTITPPAGLSVASPAGGQYTVTLFANGAGGPDSFEAANFGLTGCTQQPPPGSVGDTVYCDTNGNGTQDPGEAGIPGVTVTLVRKDAGGNVIATLTATTDANGKYLFTGIPAGPIEVSVNVSSVPITCSVPVCATTVTRNLAAGENYMDADFCFTPPPPDLGRIGDTVYCDTNGNGVQDPGESGIAGVKVTLVCKDGAGNVIATVTATTDSNGKYLFINVPPGVCVVTVDVSTVPTDCSVPVCATTVTHTLAAGESYLNADFCFKPPPSGPGTGTPGYWKNHPEAWPVATITIGGRTYTKAQAIALMNVGESGDKTYTVFRHLVSAKLNLLIGTEASCINASIAAADAWMATYPVGSGVAGKSAAWGQISGTATTLDNYNNGLLCAPHRD